MQRKKVSTARVLASQIKKVARGRSKPKWLFLATVVLLALALFAIVRNRGVTESANAKVAPKQQGHSGTKRPLSPKIDLLTAPKLDVLLQRVRNALGPFTKAYRDRVEVEPLSTDTALVCKVTWSSPREDMTFPDCQAGPCPVFETLVAAKAYCEKVEDECDGITQTPDGLFQPRSMGSGLTKSRQGERSWKKIPDYCKTKDIPARSRELAIWEAFHDVVDAALEDESLNLMKEMYPTREDGSIFVSIASYRDHTCAATLQKAFERAKYPEKLSVGIVQQNCVHPTKCMTGTGWGNTRRWVAANGPDPDCAKDFCLSPLGKPHCENGRVRILRLDEIDALGPFFTRFINSKLWRGENFYLQIDAHTDFRSSWDESLIAQMRATKSYPYSVISNYPPSGTPNSKKPWPALAHPTTPNDDVVPSALCGCSFEEAGGGHLTVRLSHTSRDFGNEPSRPRRSLFVAAGFFIAHGSIVNKVGFDPFLPFLFMGEEIALSIRFYTNGYDIYAPSVDVLKHEYVRKEAPKFWETLGEVYSNPNIHNRLTNTVVRRVQNLLKFPESDSEDKIQPQSLITRLDRFGLGTVRSAEQFVEVSNLDLVKKTQRVPKWCTSGGEPIE